MSVKASGGTTDPIYLPFFVFDMSLTPLCQMILILTGDSKYEMRHREREQVDDILRKPSMRKYTFTKCRSLEPIIAITERFHERLL